MEQILFHRLPCVSYAIGLRVSVKRFYHAWVAMYPCFAGKIGLVWVPFSIGKEQWQPQGCCKQGLLYRNALGKVARFIHIATASYGHAIGKKLQGDDHQQQRLTQDGDVYS